MQGVVHVSGDIRGGAGMEREMSLCELLDRVLNKGVVLTGEVVISVAGVDLIYVGLNVVLSSVETLLLHMGEGGCPGMMNAE